MSEDFSAMDSADHIRMAEEGLKFVAEQEAEFEAEFADPKMTILASTSPQLADAVATSMHLKALPMQLALQAAQVHATLAVAKRIEEQSR